MSQISLSCHESLSTREVLQEKRKGSNRFTIGVLREDKEEETRVPLTPQGVAMLVDGGHKVFVEKDLGVEANFFDEDYTKHGACIVSRKEVLKQDLILKINAPELSDIEMMKKGTMVLSLLRFCDLCKERLMAMKSKGITAVALDWIEGGMGECPVADSMHEIEGNTAVVYAASLCMYPNGKGAVIGSVAGVSPSEVVILGAGTAGLSAARCAIGMGATVKFFDTSLRALQKVRTMFGDHIFTSVLHPNALVKSLKSAEVVIAALETNAEDQSFVLTENLLSEIKKDTVLVDLNMHRGGSFEGAQMTSIEKPSYKKDGVLYCCLPAISAMYPRTASIALSNIIATLILGIDRYENRGQYICSEYGFQSGIYMYNGVLSNFEIGRRFNIPAKDIQLLLTVF